MILTPAMVEWIADINRHHYVDEIHIESTDNENTLTLTAFVDSDGDVSLMHVQTFDAA